MLIWYALYCAFVIIPFWQLLPRFGLPSYLALMAAFPLLAVVLLWLIAFGDKIGFGGGK